MVTRPSYVPKLLVVLSFVVLSALMSPAQTQTSSAAQPDSTKAAPAPNKPEDKSLVEGAQEQFKKLHDYVHPPEPVKDMGDPSVKVWADLRTALYYCPGSKQYGHTPKGKYLTQKDAQDSNFESALRVPCPKESVVEAKKPAKKTSKTASKKSAPATGTNSKQSN